MKFIHTMVPDFDDENLNELIRQHNYESLFKYTEKLKPRVPIHGALFMKNIYDFMNSHLNMITLKNYNSLKDCLGDNKIAIMYHNQHLSTIVKHRNELYILITDTKYYKFPSIVFKKLYDYGYDSLYNGKFIQLGIKPTKILKKYS